MAGEWQRQKACASNGKETHSGRGVAGVCPSGRLQLLAKQSLLLTFSSKDECI